MCQRCELWKGRNKAAFDRGNYESPILICGMCPGPDENAVGIPFVGAAGQVLNAIIGESLGQNDAYITNLVKCYVTPGMQLQNDWMNTCLPYFLGQIGVLNPKVVIALGKDVCNYLLGANEEMKNLRGQVQNYFGRKLVCTYHPSYLARGGGIKHKHYNIVVEDFKKALAFI